MNDRLEPQPEVKTDAGVRPGNRQQGELDPFHVRARDPIGQKDVGVGGGGTTEQQADHANGAEMRREPKRNAQAQQELGDFNGSVAEMPALIDRPKSERKMNDRRGVERRVDYGDAPPPHVDVHAPPLHHRE